MVDMDESLVVAGRVGHADFINGQYNIQDEQLNGKPIFRSDHEIPPGYEQASGCQLFLYFHEANDAWVISHALNSLDVIAYCPSHLKSIWYVATGKGPFQPDPNVKLVAASTGQILTRLGPWTCDAHGEVALKIESDGPGSERPMTVLELLRGVVERFPDAQAIASLSSSGDWMFRTYSQLFEEVQLIARAFCRMGLQEFHSVLIIGTNSPEWTLASMAAIVAGGIAASLYESSQADQIQSAIERCNADIILVDSKAQLDKVLAVQTKAKVIIQYLGAVDTRASQQAAVYGWSDVINLGKEVTPSSEVGRLLDLRQQSLRANKCAVIVHTQGTSDVPKAVMLSHDNITWTARAIAQAIGAEPSHDTVVSYLPLANATVQMMDIWIALASVSTVYYGAFNPLDQLDVINTLKKVSPTLFLSVPWVWERFAEICQDTRKLTSKIARRGSEGSLRLQAGEQVDWKFKSADRKVFSKIKKAVGLSECRLAFSTDSNLSSKVAEYFLSINLPIFEVYGCSESTGFHTMSMPGLTRPSSCGKCFPGVQIRMMHGDHEVLMFGRHICMGYLNDVDSTAEAMDERGWFHSGDTGQADKAGFLYVSSRLTDTVLTVGGTKVSPQALEHTFKRNFSALVDQVVLVGHKRRTLGILLTLKTELDDSLQPTDKLVPSAQKLLKEKAVSATTIQQALDGENGAKIWQYVEEIIEKTMEKVQSEDQKVTKFQILAGSFSRRTGELAPLFKLNRRFVLTNYKPIVDEMYAGEAVEDYESAEWYHGPISRQDADLLLKRDNGGYDGWFLIRISTKEANTFVVTCCSKGKLFHNQVKYTDGMYCTHKEQGNHQYKTLQELVDHHKQGKNGFQVVLTKPCQKLK